MFYIDDELNKDNQKSNKHENEGVEEKAGWDIDDDIDIPADVNLSVTQDTDDDTYFVASTKGMSQAKQSVNNSKLPVDHILAGLL